MINSIYVVMTWHTISKEKQIQNLKTAVPQFRKNWRKYNLETVLGTQKNGSSDKCHNIKDDLWGV